MGEIEIINLEVFITISFGVAKVKNVLGLCKFHLKFHNS